MKKNAVFERISITTPEHVKERVRKSFGISNNIDSILKSKGISTDEFAVLTGKKIARVKKWLSGSHNFTPATIASIEKALDEKITTDSFT